jgi:hypothetical protein
MVSEEGSQFSDWTGPRTWNWVATPRGAIGSKWIKTDQNGSKLIKTNKKQIKCISSRHPGRTDSRKNMENPNEDTLCNCGTFLNNFLIEYNKDQIVLKTLLCTMMRKIEQLEEVQKICEPMGHQYPSGPRPPASQLLQMHALHPGHKSISYLLKWRPYKNSQFKWGLWPTTKTTCSQ